MPTNDVQTRNITMGYDAEFILQGPNQEFVPALSCIKDNGHGNHVGLDGITDLGEFRCKPSTDVTDLVKSLRTNLRNLPPEAKMRKVVAGAYPSGQPIGCHIHFGINGSNLLPSIASTVGLFLTIIEPKPDGLQRFLAAPPNTDTRYGNIMAFKTTGYGIEYKMPWSFIINPELMYFVLGFSQIIAFLTGYNPHGLDCLISSEEYLKITLDKLYHDREYSLMKDFFLKAVFPGLLDNEKVILENHSDRFSGFTEKEREICDRIKDMVQNDFTVDANVDLRETWRVPNEPIEFIQSASSIPYPVVPASKKSLRPVFVRITDNQISPIMISGFNNSDEVKAIKIANDLGMKIAVLRKLSSLIHCCPVVHIGSCDQSLIQKFLTALKKSLEGK